MQLFVVINPAAGRAQAEEVRRALARYLPPPKWQLTTYETSGRESVPDVVRQALADGAEWVLAAGGDGTVSAVADGLAGSGVPLGIIPAGTGNALAQELGIPQNIERAVQLLAGRPPARPLDAIQCDGRHFVLAVGTGMDAYAISGASRQAKRRLGRLAYLASTLKVALGVQPRVFTLVADGRRRRVRAAAILIANIGTLTRPMRWGKHIQPDDGWIDICILRASNLLDILLVGWDILMPGRPRRDRNLRFWRARHQILVLADRPLPVQGDGEMIGQTPIELRVAPAAIQVLAPAAAASPMERVRELAAAGAERIKGRLANAG
ncbi:MAG: diacylglycerol/lipid kinase family protein [Candidatus Promineifilaceae bacterium]